MAADDHESTIRETVREHDPDRYIAALFAPARVRPALMALYAFSIDVGRVPAAVSEPMLGEIRLQWWRDALQTLEKGGITGNPVADALGAAMREHKLPKALLLGAIDARSFDLSGELMPDEQALKAYLQKTSGNIFAAAGRMIADEARPADLDRLAAEAGQLWGLTHLLAALPLHLSRGRFYLPASSFHDHGADPTQLLEGRADEKAKATLASLREDVSKGWEKLRPVLRALPRPVRDTFLPLTLIPAYLKAVERQAGAPLEAVAGINPLVRLTKLTGGAATGRI